MSLVFTRLLYPKEDVITTMVDCFYNKRSYDEFIYWLCEYYFSGYHEDTFNILITIYYTFIHIEDNDNKIINFIKQKYSIWKKSINKKPKHNLIINVAEKLYFTNMNTIIYDLLRPYYNDIKKITLYKGKKPEWFKEFNEKEKGFIYSIYKKNENNMIHYLQLLLNNNYDDEKILNLCKCKELNLTFDNTIIELLDVYCLTKHVVLSSVLIKMIMGNNYKETFIKRPKREKIEKEVIDNYMTIYESDKPRNILREKRKYTLNVERCDDDNEELMNSYFYKWLYYSYDCPLWLERIQKYNGKKNDEKKEIEFDENEKEGQESLFDQFWNKYNYEPDEQCIEIENQLKLDWNNHKK